QRGQFADMIQRLAPPSAPWRTVDARADDLPAFGEIGGLVITGSAASVTERAPWMLGVEEYLRGAVDHGLPTLGICFGHQLLGQALGGQVAKNPAGREMGSVMYLEADADDVVSAPEARDYWCNMSHVDSVVELPPGAQVLGSTRLEPHAALRFNERTWGVQFHPEFDDVTMRAYIEERRDILLGEGIDPEQMLRDVRPGVAGSGVVLRFLELL
ncbi:MAG TPA: gamma-glutamyl-gamma-aminobutyrate hydrolase family protein, partial [Polyangiaceae bacterium]|nr:gamma-glutamyl-gamma-aminobutyrate hydrolase family protein [Polyangiaceae bacterium]